MRRSAAGVVALAAIVAGALAGLTACSSSHHEAAPPRPSSSTTTSLQVPTSDAPKCGASSDATNVWPVTGTAQTTSWSAVPLLVEHFVTDEFGLSAGGVRVEQRPDDCALHMKVAGSSAVVQIMGGPGAYRVTGLDYPDPGKDVALSIAIHGRRVDVYTPPCAGCRAVFKIRYSNTKSEATSRDGWFHAVLREPPSGPGTLVVIVANGTRIVRAHGLLLPAGDFAAS